ncbi:MAG: hypothetical protein AB7F65_00785 [Dehalococcoidia bacterium]
MSRSVSERSRRGARGTSTTAIERIHVTAPAAAVGRAEPETIADATWARLQSLRRVLDGVGILEILAMALAVRALYVVTAGFPLNDGGLFYVFARDIQNAGYALPTLSSYNDGTIPFAYPPLGFYLAALADDLTPASLLDIIWLLPMLESVAVVAAFYLLASSLLRDRWTVLLATIAFALVPRSFIWLIMGGGLTRALALTLALLAIHQARSAVETDRGAPLVRAAVFLGLATLTTLETASWAAVSLPLFTLVPFAGRADLLRRVRIVATIGLGAFAVALPWAAIVIARHGFDPFLAAREYGGSAIGQADLALMWADLINPIHTGEPFFPLIAALGLLGAVYAVVRGSWLLPSWWLLTVVMGTRAFPTLAAISVAMLAAIAVREVIVPAFDRATAGAPGSSRFRQLVAAGVGVVTLFFLVGASLEDSRGDQRYLRPLTDAEVQAMEWIAEETPEDSTFLVISRNGWYADRDGEWFPALAERENVATVQGYEWVEGEFARREELQAMAQMCLPGEGNCLGSVLNIEAFDYVYVPETCCSAMRQLLEIEWRYEVIFDNGATVFQRVNGPVRPGGWDAYSSLPDESELP